MTMQLPVNWNETCHSSQQHCTTVKIYSCVYFQASKHVFPGSRYVQSKHVSVHNQKITLNLQYLFFYFARQESTIVPLNKRNRNRVPRSYPWRPAQHGSGTGTHRLSLAAAHPADAQLRSNTYSLFNSGKHNSDPALTVYLTVVSTTRTQHLQSI